MSAPLQVLYYTVVPLMGTGNGGSICCRNHVARLAGDPGIALTAMVAGQPEWQAGTEAFFAELGVRCYFQPFLGGHIRPARNTVRSILSFATTMVFQFPWEVQALNQPHIQQGIDAIVAGHAIQALVIDYHPSALFITLPRTGVKTVVIGLNREGDFYADLLRLGMTHHQSLTAGISLRRVRRFERRVNAGVDKVVTIGPPDLPRRGLRSPPACVTPYLDPRPERWRHSATRTVFFVGDFNHYPNRLAIEWLSARLAPALLAADPSIRIAIVGATAAQVAEPHRHPNIDFLGPSDAATVAELFRTSDVMVCPVENDYGVKFKALDALSFGTPLVASRQTLLGLPHLQDMPAIDLDDPAAAAALIAGLIDQPARLLQAQTWQDRQQADFVATQGDVWSRLLRGMVEGRAA